METKHKHLISQRGGNTDHPKKSAAPFSSSQDPSSLHCVYTPIRASVFCLKVSLGVTERSVLGAAVVSGSEGEGVLAIGMDLAIARNSWMSL